MTTNSDTAARNKQLLESAYEERARGNPAPFRELFTEQVTWTKIGTTSWSGTHAGLTAVRQMLGRLHDLLDGPHRVTAQRFIAEGDRVVVEARSESMTKAGKPYNNQYCMIYRLADGKIMEITEYCDTALIERVL